MPRTIRLLVFMLLGALLGWLYFDADLGVLGAPKRLLANAVFGVLFGLSLEELIHLYDGIRQKK